MPSGRLKSTTNDRLPLLRLAQYRLTPSAVTGQRSVPFGIFLVAANDTTLASETCEELFTPNSPNIMLSLNGAAVLVFGLLPGGLMAVCRDAILRALAT